MSIVDTTVSPTHTLVLSYDVIGAQAWAKRQGLGNTQWSFVSTPAHLTGESIGIGVRIVKVGAWSGNPAYAGKTGELLALVQAAERKGAEIVDAR